jgi:urease accessory protein
MPTNPALLLLADGRLPTGGHAHSGGLEEAVASGAVGDAATLEAWLFGRLRTTGRVEAAFAAAAAGGEASWDELDAELAARTPSQAQRAASRAQGRGLLRTARGAWPAPHLGVVPDAPLWPIALGAAARAAGLTPADAALAAATGSITGPAWAATRLLGLNPLDVASALARLAPAVEDAAATRGRPAYSAPLLEVGAEVHARWEVRLFAS